MLAVGVGTKKLVDGNQEFQLIAFPPATLLGFLSPHWLLSPWPALSQATAAASLGCCEY